MMVLDATERKKQQRSEYRYHDALAPSNEYGSNMNHDAMSLNYINTNTDNHNEFYTNYCPTSS